MSENVVEPLNADLAASIEGTPLWLALDGEAIHAVLHMAGEGPVQSAVLLLPPFGWEEVCSYRARRRWAVELARAGHPTLRLDLPGTGESSGSARDAGLLDDWLGAVANAASELRAVCGARRLIAAGIGLGGLLATVVAARGGAIDDLVLWGVPARGRAYLRELTAHSSMVAGRFPDSEQRPEDDGTLELTGFAMTRETATALGQIKLDELSLPESARRRVLMIERDQLGVDDRLRAWLERSGCELTVLPSSDYGTLMDHPENGGSIAATIAASIDWLDRSREPTASSLEEHRDRAPAGQRIVLLRSGEQGVRETLRVLDGGPEGRLVGTLCSPAEPAAAPFCLVMSNPGALRRSGPNRMWVELARRWAARGIPSVRFDMPGLGDSAGDDDSIARQGAMYEPRLTDRLLEVLAALREDGVHERFVLVGLCSGAYWAFHAALAERSIEACVLINLWGVEWSPELVAERDRRRSAEIVRSGLVARIREGRLPLHALPRAMRALRAGIAEGFRSREAAQAELIEEMSQTLKLAGTRVLLLFSAGEPMLAQLRGVAGPQWWDGAAGLRYEQLPSHDHDLRALWAQRLVHDRLDRELEELIAHRVAQAGVSR
jgi:pimeloyl-ACP methyl ester carboxylesterase